MNALSAIRPAAPIDVAGICIGERVASRMADPMIQTWIELRFAIRPLTLADIIFAVRQRCEVSARAVIDAIDSWMTRGFVEPVPVRPAAFVMASSGKVLSDPPPLAECYRPRRPLPPRSPRQRLWTAMRVLKRFDLVTLTMAADVSEQCAKTFLRTMTRASYLREVVLPTGCVSWVAGSRPWGPQPPVVKHVRIDRRPVQRVIDRNDGTVIDLALRPHRADRVGTESGVATYGEALGGRVNHVC